MCVYVKARETQQHHRRMEKLLPILRGKKPFNYFSDVDAVHWQKSRWAMNPRVFYKTPVYSSSYGLLEKKLPFCFRMRKRRVSL